MVKAVKPYKPKKIYTDSVPKKTRYSISDRAALGLMPSEQDIQIDVLKECAYYKYEGIKISEILCHIPNGGGRSKAEGGILKAMGVQAGMPDFLLPIPKQGYGSLYIEMKDHKGRVRPEQKQKIALLEKLGNKVIICRTVKETIAEIKSYLGI